MALSQIVSHLYCVLIASAKAPQWHKAQELPAVSPVLASHDLSNEISKWFSLIIPKCQRFSGLWIVPRRLQAKTRPARVTKSKNGRRKRVFGRKLREIWFSQVPCSARCGVVASLRPSAELLSQFEIVIFQTKPGTVFFPNKKRHSHVSTWSFLAGCVALFPPVEKHSWEEPSLNSRLPITPRGLFFNQSICLVIRAVGRCKKVKKQTANFSVISSSQFRMILILSSQLHRALPLRISKVLCFQNDSTFWIGCAWPSCWSVLKMMPAAKTNLG